MSGRYRQRVPTLFAEEERFELEPAYKEVYREQLEARFSELKENLLGELLNETQTLTLKKRFRQVAGEAAGLAWTTEFPLLVYPALFEELASDARKRHTRQEQIKVRSETLLARAV